MARSAASYGAAVLHAPQVRFIYSPFQMKQLHFIPLLSIFRYHSKYEVFASLI